MKILVTGGSGRIGRYVVKELAGTGHDVTSVDILSPEERSPRFLRIDLTDAGEVYQALATVGAEAVVHLGAWANAGVVPDTRTYGDNVRGTFNLFQACADWGIQRVISASSAQVYGFAKAPPVYVPVDEAHPLRPTNCYALSKVVGEQAADYFVECFGMTILSFRFMGIRVMGCHCYGHERTLAMRQLRVGSQSKQCRCLQGPTISLVHGSYCQNRLRHWWDTILETRQRFEILCPTIFLP